MKDIAVTYDEYTHQTLSVTKKISLIMFACAVFQLLVESFFYTSDLHGSLMALVLFGFAILFYSAHFFTQPRHLNLARSILLSGFILYIAFVSLRWGHNVNAQYMLLIGVLVINAISRHREKLLRRISAAALIGTFLGLELHLYWPMTTLDAKLCILNSAVLVLFTVVAHTMLKRHSDVKFERTMTNYHSNQDLLKTLFPSKPDQPQFLWQPGVTHNIDNVCVLFSDLQGYTQLNEKYSDEEIVVLLDKIYSRFDAIASRYSVEKIKTNGDEYMAAIGIPVTLQDYNRPTSSNAVTMCRFALELQETFYEFCIDHELPCNIRIGVATGSVTAGIIGTRRPAFDIWGKTVNRASRLESSGSIDAIHICNETTLLIKETFLKDAKYSFEPSSGKQTGKCFKLINKNISGRSRTYAEKT